MHGQNHIKVAGITKGDDIVQMWSVWRKKGNVINGFVCRKCIGKWEL